MFSRLLDADLGTLKSLGGLRKLGCWPSSRVAGCFTSLYRALGNCQVLLGPAKILFELDPRRLPGS